jgi:hypothetical protein
MPYTVIFTPESEAQLTELYRNIAATLNSRRGGPLYRFHCDVLRGLQSLPHRGIQRNDISIYASVNTP